MRRAVLSLLLIAMMVLSTTTALADDLTGSTFSGWDRTGDWIGDSITSGAMVATSGTATYAVHTGASGAFNLDIASKYGDIRSHTMVGVITEDGRKATIEFNPVDLTYYANVDGSTTPIIHDWANPYDDHHAVISSADGKSYTFSIGGTSQSIDVGSMPASIYIQFDNNGASPIHNPANEAAGKGSGYDLPVLYSVVWTSPEIAPVAAINSATPASADDPLTVNFVGSGTNRPTSYTWDFGDGTTASGASVTHTYATAGSYPVKLTASNTGGAGEITTTIIVKPPRPVASIDMISPATSYVGDLVTFQGSGTNSPTSLEWIFDDGSVDSGASVTHAFTTAGDHSVTLKAINDGGESLPVSKTFTITEPVVVPEPIVVPVASILSATPASEENSLTINFVGSGTNGATIYEWDFGDESEHGSGAEVSHTYSVAGPYEVKLWASNGDGTSEPTTALINVATPVVVSPSPSPSPATATDHNIDPAQAKAFCEYQFYSPDSVITYDGKGGYTVSDPRKVNATTVANPSSGPTLFAVSGQVISEADNKPVADASVVLGDSIQKTNGNGEFKFDGLKAGTYDLAVSADGYVAKTVKVEVSEDKLISLQLEKVSAGIATSASAANETANMTTTTTDSSAVAGNTSAANATATPSTARSPGFEFIAVLIAILVVAGVLVFVWRKK